MSNTKQETKLDKQPIPVPVEGTKIILYKLENCVCKIYKDNGEKGSGFFCNIPYFDETLPFLITNIHVRNEQDIKKNKIIELTINNTAKKIIKIDETRKRYTNKDIDVTFIEIRQNEDDNFLELDEDIYKVNTLFYLFLHLYVV